MEGRFRCAAHDHGEEDLAAKIGPALSVPWTRELVGSVFSS